MLASAESLAHVFRARVFQRIVDLYIRHQGWEVEDGKGLRWAVRVAANRLVMIVPVFGPPHGTLVDEATSRLRGHTSLHWFVVVPLSAETATSAGSERGSVVTLDRLADRVTALGPGNAKSP